MITSLRLATADGLSLDAELNEPDGPARAGMVLCAPHPLSGGNMCATVVDDLFGALPAHGIACLRFDFRGVGSSEGVHDDGIPPRAAAAHLARRRGRCPDRLRDLVR